MRLPTLTSTRSVTSVSRGMRSTPAAHVDRVIVLQAYSGIAAAAREHGLFPAVSMYNENDSMTILGPKNGQHELSYRDTDESKHTVRRALSWVCYPC